jgi:predicted HAD superfamily Cof-like phosphohydrolase
MTTTAAGNSRTAAAGNRAPSTGARTERVNSNAERVREFHQAIGEEPPRSPVVPDLALLALRRKLIEEENAEVMEALARLEGVIQSEGNGVAEGDDAKGGRLEESFAAAAHELADLLYVTYGALVWFGIDADAVFAEVHSANMRKTSGPKRADGKQLKPAGWVPANVAAVIARARAARASDQQE